jgi:hypothetical protein
MNTGDEPIQPIIKHVDEVFIDTEHQEYSNQFESYGLTKREYIATKAMAALLVNSSGDDTLVAEAVSMADALLLRLNKPSAPQRVNPAMDKVECDGVGDNNGFFEFTSK